MLVITYARRKGYNLIAHKTIITIAERIFQGCFWNRSSIVEHTSLLASEFKWEHCVLYVWVSCGVSNTHSPCFPLTVALIARFLSMYVWHGFIITVLLNRPTHCHTSMKLIRTIDDWTLCINNCDRSFENVSCDDRECDVIPVWRLIPFRSSYFEFWN